MRLLRQPILPTNVIIVEIKLDNLSKVSRLIPIELMISKDQMVWLPLKMLMIIILDQINIVQVKKSYGSMSTHISMIDHQIMIN